MGTTADVLLVGDAGADATLLALDQLLAEADLLASRFIPHSELSCLNRSSSARVAVSPRLAEFVEDALRWARATGGRLDPTVGEALGSLGYSCDFDHVSKAGAADLPEAVAAPGWRLVRTVGHLVSRPPGVQIDLGATAKARLVDEAAEIVLRSNPQGGLVSFGGDIAWAGAEPESGWVVRVADDHRGASNAPGQTIRLSAHGLATSSTTTRTWTRGGVCLHHLIDPATGRPACGPWRTITVAAPTCLEANALSTAAIVAGADAPAFLGRWPVSARLVDNCGRALHLGGWPPDGDSQLAAPGAPWS